MALAVFLLLIGILAAEIALFGIAGAGWVGAGSFLLCAAVLTFRRSRLEPPRMRR